MQRREPERALKKALWIAFVVGDLMVAYWVIAVSEKLLHWGKVDAALMGLTFYLCLWYAAHLPQSANELRK